MISQSTWDEVVPSSWQHVRHPSQARYRGEDPPHVQVAVGDERRHELQRGRGGEASGSGENKACLILFACLWYCLPCLSWLAVVSIRDDAAGCVSRKKGEGKKGLQYDASGSVEILDLNPLNGYDLKTQNHINNLDSLCASRRTCFACEETDTLCGTRRRKCFV